MRKLERPPAPPCLATDTDEQAQAQRTRYAAQHYPSGGWRAWWNDLEKDDDGVSAPRRALLAMSDGECAYCGMWTGNDHMQVDHILPKERFPFVAYAWENLLPACDACNRRKASFVPASLEGKTIVERCLGGTTPHDHLFDKLHLFTAVARDDRLVDPSFDAPEEHVELLMDVPDYRPKSPIGKLTYRRFLRHPEIAERLRKVRDLARIVLDLPLSPEQLHTIAVGSSHPSLFHRFVAYWRASALTTSGPLPPASSSTPHDPR